MTTSATTCQRCRTSDCTVAVGARRLCKRCWMAKWKEMPPNSPVERLAGKAADLAAMMVRHRWRG